MHSIDTIHLPTVQCTLWIRCNRKKRVCSLPSLRNRPRYRQNRQQAKTWSHRTSVRMLNNPPNPIRGPALVTPFLVFIGSACCSHRDPPPLYILNNRWENHDGYEYLPVLEIKGPVIVGRMDGYLQLCSVETTPSKRKVILAVAWVIVFSMLKHHSNRKNE